MAYTKTNFRDGDTLTAAHMNKIESGIIAVDESLKNKQDKLYDRINIKTINGQGITGPGNIEIKAEVNIDVDSTLSTVSTNPIQNKTVTEALNGKQNILKASNFKTVNGESVFGAGEIIIPVDDTLNAASSNAIQNQAVKRALDSKQTILVSGTNIKTLDGQSLLGQGDIHINTSSNTSSWAGKSAVFVGDSITDKSNTTVGYHEVLNDLVGFESVTNLGLRGSCFSAKSDYGTSIAPLTKRYTSIPYGDLIMVYMGTNDYGHETPMGTIDDTTDISFYGALNVVVPGLIAKHPKSRIIFCTPLHRYGFGTSSVTGKAFTYDHIKNGRGHTLKDYAEAIKDVCGRYGIPVIDLYSQSGLNPCIAEIKSLYFPDGLHPNAEGHHLIAQMMYKFINLYALKAPPVMPGIMDLVVTMVIGMKAGGETAVSNTKRISSNINLSLSKDMKISLLDPSKYDLAVYKCATEEVSLGGNTLITGTWVKGPYTVDAAGWYNICIKKVDDTVFNLTAESTNLWDYVKIESIPSGDTGDDDDDGDEGGIMDTAFTMVIGMAPGGETHVTNQKRISTSINLNLTKGMTVSLRDNSTYRFALYLCATEQVSIGGNNLITGGWLSDSYTIPESGWYNVVIKKADEGEFNLSTESTNLWDYVTIN